MIQFHQTMPQKTPINLEFHHSCMIHSLRKIVYDGEPYYFSRKDNYGGNIISTNNKQLYGRYVNRKVELSNPEHKYSLIRDFVLLSPKLIEIIDTDLPYRKGNSDFNSYEAEFEKQQIEVIERQRTVKAVKDVIQTIDREQYDIISYEDSKKCIGSWCRWFGQILHYFKTN